MGSNNGQPPAMTVRSCPSGMPAVGVWQEITPPQIKLVPHPPGEFTGSAGIVAVAVNPLDPATVYAAGGHQKCCVDGSDGIFKSTDCGVSWKKINTGINGTQLDSGWQWSSGIVLSFKNPNVMYTQSGYGAEGLFKSTDGGVNWAQLFGPTSEIARTVGANFTENVAMDPTDPEHLVVTFHADCTGPFGPMCMAETTDGGNKWRLFKGPTNGWQEAAGAMVLNKTTFLYGSGSGLYFTEDNGAIWEKVAPAGYFQLYRSPTGTMYVGTGQDIISSRDGHTWTSLPNSPRATNVFGDGTALFSSFMNDIAGQPIWTAMESKGGAWSNVKTPPIRQGTTWFDYDSQHHILYSANLNGGLWRTVTK